MHASGPVNKIEGGLWTETLAEGQQQIADEVTEKVRRANYGATANLSLWNRLISENKGRRENQKVYQQVYCLLQSHFSYCAHLGAIWRGKNYVDHLSQYKANNQRRNAVS